MKKAKNILVPPYRITTSKLAFEATLDSLPHHRVTSDAFTERDSGKSSQGNPVLINILAFPLVFHAFESSSFSFHEYIVL